MTLTHHLTNRQLADLEQELRDERARLERSATARTASGGPWSRGDTRWSIRYGMPTATLTSPDGRCPLLWRTRSWR